LGFTNPVILDQHNKIFVKEFQHNNNKKFVKEFKLNNNKKIVKEFQQQRPKLNSALNLPKP